MNNNVRNIIAAALLALPIGAMAVPAQPGVVMRYQADGTVVPVRLEGDEFSHRVLSEDGWPLLEKQGTLYFAELSANGQLRPSAFKAAQRMPQTEAFLASQDKTALLEASSARMKAVRRSAREKNPGLHATSFPHIGSPRALVILVEYPDLKCGTPNAGDYFQGFLNEEGFGQWGATGSALDYFRDNSDGKFTPQFDLIGPVTLPHEMAYYGANGGGVAGNDVNPAGLVVDACQLMDSEIDFSVYDHDSDGLIDNVFLFFAGLGENSGGMDDTVWPHSWDVRAAFPDEEYIFDGVQLGHYACTNEWKGDRPDGIGIFIHEFSHVLGLPDLYVTGGANTGAFTPHDWSVLDYGPYNNKSRTPAGYSAYERYALDWVEPVEFSEPDNITLHPLQESNEAYILKSVANPDEYFLFENRQNTKWDYYLPGHGMLVWHVDYDYDAWEESGINNNPSHQRVDLLEADGLLTATTRAGDAFPGTAGITAITNETCPSLKTWSGEDLETPITDIAESRSGVITFRVKGGLPDSEAPVLAEATEVGSYGFKLSWNAVENAEEYILSIAREDKEDPFFTETLGSDVTSYTISDIAPETTYIATVSCRQAGKGISAPSNAVTVTTGAATFEWYAPRGADASLVGDRYFTANWEPLENASEYFLSVFHKADVVTRDEYYEFYGGTECLPPTWECNSTTVFEQAANSGERTPSLRMNGNASAYIQSGEFENDIHSISFWHRGVNKAEGNTLEVTALVDGEWVPVASVTVTEQAGGRLDTVDCFPAGARAFHIDYKTAGTNKGPIAFDDLTVRIEKSFSKEIVNGMDGVTAGNACEMKVTGLDPETVYFYSVRGFDGSLWSKESKAIRVKTFYDGYNEIESILTGGGDTPRWFTLQGWEVKNPQPGLIYIRVDRRGSRKIVF